MMQLKLVSDVRIAERDKQLNVLGITIKDIVQKPNLLLPKLNQAEPQAKFRAYLACLEILYTYILTEASLDGKARSVIQGLRTWLADQGKQEDFKTWAIDQALEYAYELRSPERIWAGLLALSALPLTGGEQKCLEVVTTVGQHLFNGELKIQLAAISFLQNQDLKQVVASPQLSPLKDGVECLISKSEKITEIQGKGFQKTLKYIYEAYEKLKKI